MNIRAQAYVSNALTLLKQSQRVHKDVHLAYKRLNALHVKAGLEDFLTNPFISTAMSILKTFSTNYKIKQAIKLLQEAGEEAKKKKKK